MKDPIVVMQRHELKYLLTPAQTALLRERLQGHMQVDRYGLTSIASLYYDTPDYRLINASLEATGFKEKLRLRSYGIATDDSPVYLELKRKADGVVYKRRVQATLPQVGAFFGKGEKLGVCGQIAREVDYFRRFYGDLAPTCMIICERTAYFEPGGDLRLTIDESPRYRTEQLDLRAPMRGTPLLPPGCTILEIKVQQSMPRWLIDILEDGKIRKTRFSKYGEAYKRQMTALRATA